MPNTLDARRPMGELVDALDTPLREARDLASGAPAPPIPAEWDEAVAAVFDAISSPSDYLRLLASMSTERNGRAETFASRRAQQAVRLSSPGLLRSAILAASVRAPVSRGWDDATYAVAAVIRACQVAHWEFGPLVDELAAVIGEARIGRLHEVAAYKTPILDVAGMHERTGPHGWELF